MTSPSPRSWRRDGAPPWPPRRGGAGLILDVGVGTGLELPMFNADVKLVGVDLSEPMLRRAQTRVKREKLRQVAGLCVMDATRLAFPSHISTRSWRPLC